MAEHGSKRSRHSRRSRRHGSKTNGFGFTSDTPAEPKLVIATDVCWWITFLATLVCFGGRAACGQLILSIGAALTACVWLFHLMTTDKPSAVWTGSEKYWLLGIVVCLVQVIPLPASLLLILSPRLREIIPEWSTTGPDAIFPGGWTCLSLAPYETWSALATFVAYAMMFIVMAQRIQTVVDVNRMLHRIALLSVVFSIFALAQLYLGNGKFFWVYAHPMMTTETNAKGCFTNRNHFAQFLAMTIGPLLYCGTYAAKKSAGHNSSLDSTSIPLLPTLCFAGLGISIIAGLLSLSRGGLVAIGVAMIVCLVLLRRCGSISIQTAGGLCMAAVLGGSVFFFTGFEKMAGRLDESAEVGAKTLGRMEIWKANIDVAGDFPVTGTGIGTHEEAHQLRLDIHGNDGHVFTHAESGYLQVFSEAGSLGLGTAILFILASFWWCFDSLRSPDTEVQAAAGAVTASLLANVVHAATDFFWYTPSCMLLLAIQMAAVLRLRLLKLEASGRPAWTFLPSRSMSCLGLCGALALALWMVDLKLPAALAEPARMEYVMLSHSVEPEDEEDKRMLRREQRQAAMRAAKLHPFNARYLEAAGAACVDAFDARQEQSENMMPFTALQDVIRSSQFESQQQLDDWMQRAIGQNTRFLKLADKKYRRALSLCPLMAISYLRLAQIRSIIFLNDPHSKEFHDIALALRPHNPIILLAVGQYELVTGDMTSALGHWRESFVRSPSQRKDIVEGLAGQVNLQFFIETFNPDWETLGTIAAAFDKHSRPDEAAIAWQRFIEVGHQRLTEALAGRDQSIRADKIARLLRVAYRSIGDTEGAIQFMSRMVVEIPYSFEVRQELAMDLVAQERWAEAADHLQWCATRRPDSDHLQTLAARAVKERLRNSVSSPNGGSKPSSILQTGGSGYQSIR